MILIAGNLFGRHGRNQMTHWRVILAAMIGVIVGGAITAGLFLYSSTRVREENTARELLSEVVALLALQEGWLLQGEGSQTAKLSDHPGLTDAKSSSGLWLLPVELRAILDEAQWNSPPIRATASYKGATSGLSEIKYCLTLRFHIREPTKRISPRSSAPRESRNYAPGLNGSRLLTTAGR